MKLNFKQGIHTATEDIDTPEGYYKDAENMRISGNAKRSEEGTTQITGIPTNFIEWGDCAIGFNTILLGTIAGKSVIGSLSREGLWTVLVPARVNDILGIVGPTQVEGKKNWAGEDVIYFSTPSGARRINLTQDLPSNDIEFDKVTSLFLEYDLPQVTYTGENSTGSLLSGVYQLAARLVTESGAATPFGVLSSVIPVVQSSLNSPRASVVGNEPQTATSKSINLSITNIDTAFKSIELGVLTYVGSANTPVVTKTSRISINGQTTLQYTYRGAEDDDDSLTIDELITSGIAYSTGEFFTQKDDSLIIGAATEAEMPDIDWFRVAENITSKFVVKRIAYKETLGFSGSTYTAGDTTENYSMVETSSDPMDQGYKNPITCVLYKGYRRNEVYSLTLTPVFVNGVQGPTVHIPANDAANTAATNTDGNPNNGGLLGTYISEELYPDDRYTGLLGTGLRLHKFPDAVLQPVIEGSVETNNCFIRVLGIELSGIALDASELQFADQIAGFIIGRVDRRGQETQLAQGIVRPNTNIRFNDENDFSRSTTLGDGYTDWFIDVSEGGSATQGEPTGALDLADFTFVAPDLIHNKYQSSQASHIKQHSVYKADPYAAPLDFNHNSIPNRELFNHHYSFFKNIVGDNTAQAIDQTEVELDGLRLDVAPFGVPVAPQSKGGKVNYNILLGSKKLEMCSSSGFVWFTTLNNVPIKYHRDFASYYECNQRSGQGTYWGRNIYTQAPGFRADFVLHTLTRQNTKQYGPLDQMTSMFVHYEPWQGFSGTTEFFNGDTFINKYGLTVFDEALWPYTDNTDGADNPNQVGLLKPANYSGIVYMWIESDNNYDYRHYIQPASFTEDDVTSAGSMPFYPAYKQIVNNAVPFGLLSMHAENWVHPGYANRYNNQYSTQPTAKPYVVTPQEDVDKRSSLVNRVIYSSQAVQGEKTDGYQIFLPNNYYDIPQSFGELTDVYVNGELFASTRQVQWKLFFNTLATQATSAGEVVLGTGGAFNRPAVPLTTVDGGFGGTTHWTHATNTVFGRVFIDRVQGKFFIGTDKLMVISQDLKDTDRLFIQNAPIFDMFVGSEPLRERAFFKVNDVMWSYNLERKFFVSRHTYAPKWMFSHGPYMYSNQIDPSKGTTGIFKHSTGPDGWFYGRLHNCSITIVANMENTKSKEFRVLDITTKRTTNDGLLIPFSTFNKMEIWNDERYTGVLDITPHTNTFQKPGVLEVLSNKVKDSFRMNFSRDIVKDPSKDIFAVSNHAQLKSDTTLTKWLPRMKGAFVNIKLISDSSQGTIFIFDAEIELDENIR